MSNYSKGIKHLPTQTPDLAAWASSTMIHHVIIKFHMSSHFPFLHSLSPLTSLPELPETPKFNFASSPWSSPCRRPIKRKTKHTEQRNETSSTDHKHRYVQSPHWHISQARRQTTSYRGLSSELDPNRTVLSQDLSAAARLSALKNTGYRLVPFEK